MPRWVVLAIVLLVGCASAGSTPTGPPAATGGTEPTGETGPASAALCENAYLPVVEGASWSYRVDAWAGLDTRYTDVVTTVADDGFVVSTRFPGLTKRAGWSCTKEGLVALDYGGGPSVSLTTLGAESSFDTPRVSGVTIPADVGPGDTWRQAFRIHGEAFLSDDVTAVTDGDVRIAFEATGIGEVTVPAGTFSALRIDMDIRMDLSIDTGGGAAPLRTTVTGSSWFAEGVGMVRASNRGDLAGAILTSETVLTEVEGL